MHTYTGSTFSTSNLIYLFIKCVESRLVSQYFFDKLILRVGDIASDQETIVAQKRIGISQILCSLRKTSGVSLISLV